MKKIIMIVVTILTLILACFGLSGCGETEEYQNTKTAMEGSGNIIDNQPAPTDLEYSLERYNVIKRAYWVNGQREKAMALPCAVERPLGYIILFSESGAVVGKFVVDGKVSSLNSYLFPAEYPMRLYDTGDRFMIEIAGIDGCYGSNVSGIFFFTTDGKYIEWTGDFLYSDIPFATDEPILKTE